MVEADSQDKHDLRTVHLALGVGEGILHEAVPWGVFCALPIGEMRRARSTVAGTRDLVGKALAGKFVPDVIGNHWLDTTVEAMVDLQAVVEWNVPEIVYKSDPNVDRWVDDLKSLYEAVKKAQERSLAQAGRWAASGVPADDVPAFW